MTLVTAVPPGTVPFHADAVPTAAPDDGTHAAFVTECENLGIPTKVACGAAVQGFGATTKWWSSIQRRPSGKAGKDDLINDKKLGVASQRWSTLYSLTFNPLKQEIASSAQALLCSARAEVVSALRASHGDTESPRFLSALSALSSVYLGSVRDTLKEQALLEGTWKTLSRPNFRDCLGRNSNGDFVYSLGRMSFDMFRPTALKCSIQTVTRHTRKVGSLEALPASVPSSLRGEIESLASERDGGGGVGGGGGHVLHTYDIEVDFSIEPRKEGKKEPDDDAGYRLPEKPIRATMTNRGYLLPDPEDPARFTVWFTGGVMAPAKDKMDEAEARKKSKSSRKGQSSSQTSLGTIDDKAPSSIAHPSDIICPHLLHSCRRKNVCCALHGQKKLSRELRHKMKKSMSRYVRPKYGMGSTPTITGLAAGDMAEKPFSSEWEDIFAPEDNWKRSFGEKATALAARLLMGADVPDHMDDDGTMSFAMYRPIGGHVDVLYLDQDMCITRGNRGAIFVQVKDGLNMPGVNDMVQQSKRVPPSGQPRQ